MNAMDRLLPMIGATGVFRAVWALLALITAAGPSRAQAPALPPEDGVFITVANPITSEVTNRVRNLTAEALSGKNGKLISKIVFDFNPNEKEASSPDFGPCYDLAKYIHNLQNIATVAYVHEKVSRHSVLPVLACKEIVMGSANASWIGKVLDDPRARLEPQDAQVYEQYAGESRAAIVRKMFDSGVDLMRGRRNNAEYYFDGRDQAKAAAQGVVGGEQVYPAGELLLLNSDDAIRLGFCRLGNKTNRRQVAEFYGMSLDSLRTDPLHGRTPNARRVILKGQITPAMRESIHRRMKRAHDDGANTFIVEFSESGGGTLKAAEEMADDFFDLTGNENDPVQIIAFIPKEAFDTAAVVAFACSEIVMSEDGSLGQFIRPQGPPLFNPGELAAFKPALKKYMDQRNYDPLIADALLDPDFELVRVRSRNGALERRLMSGEELALDQKAANPIWQLESQIKHRGQPFVLDARMAKELHVARHVVRGRDVNEVYSEYGIESSQVKDITPDWVDQIADVLRHPFVGFLLVMIGITCLILELKIPGATAPGVIAAICFVLFFWAQSRLNGQIIILAILLFVLGLILVGIEIFVMPGFGFVGIAGILLMVIGLGLATVERMPHSESDWLELGAKFTQFGLGMILAGFTAILLARYLPSIPIANRMVLPPPGERTESGDEAPALPGVEQAAALLGAVGTAATTLRPAGMARFGEQYVDVVTEGSFIPAGARLQVIEVEGNRIVVKEV
jgi:membrane-bound ClpP family serine protease